MTETCIHFEQSLTTLLTKLSKMEWMTPLQMLNEKFRQLPEAESSFSADILNMLHQLCDARAVDPEAPISQLAAIRISALDCWTYRFYHDTNESRHYIDPLNSSVEAVCRSAQILPSSTAFPATDIIKRWAREHLR